MRTMRTCAHAGNALTFGTLLLAAASVMATCVRAAAVCPFEAVRIRSVRSGEPSTVVLQRTLDNDGVGALYTGLAPILLKEVRTRVCVRMHVYAHGALYTGLAPILLKEDRRPSRTHGSLCILV